MFTSIVSFICALLGYWLGSKQTKTDISAPHRLQDLSKSMAHMLTEIRRHNKTFKIRLPWYLTINHNVMKYLDRKDIYAKDDPRREESRKLKKIKRDLDDDLKEILGK